MKNKINLNIGISVVAVELAEGESPNLNEFFGTSYQGEIEESYDNLVKVFGEPNSGPSMDDKVLCEWVMSSPVGPIRVYNYKDGKNYDKVRGKEAKDITEWHIRGKNPKVVEIIKLFIELNK